MQGDTEPQPINIYQSLGDLLRACPDELATFSFTEIEAILEHPLPPAAYQWEDWWKNDVDQLQARAWLEAGWKVRTIRLPLRIVSFQRLPDDT